MQPPFWFQLSAFQLFSFCRNVAVGWLARSVTNHGSRITSGFRWLCPAFRCWKLDVGCSMFGVDDKPSEYNSPRPPPSGWSGGILDIPWTCPIPIAHPKAARFDQTSLSNPLACGSSAMKRFWTFDVGCWMSLNEERRENEVSAGLCTAIVEIARRLRGNPMEYLLTEK